MKFVGLDNFVFMLQDDKFYKALANNLVFSFVSVPIGLAIALVVAVIIHMKVYWKDVFKVTLFIPYISTTVAVATVWSALFHPSKGPINQWLMQLGIGQPPKWLVDPGFALIAIIIISVWASLGYKIIIYLAGLSNIPNDLYEASEIDGASALKQFWYITVPLLSPTIFFLTITTIIASFKVFDLVKFLTNGGPNDATNVLVFYLYEEGFVNFRMGYASALSWALFTIVALITSLTWFVQKQRLHY
jgi:multiple sugar transport system permease protein